jgi:hypothetical protein
VRAVLERPIPPLRMVAGEVPFDLEQLVHRLLARDPATRPASADEVRCALEEAMRSGGDAMSSHGLATGCAGRRRTTSSAASAASAPAWPPPLPTTSPS